ncbi:hypothetical protein [Variovorax sp. YR216]|uniref:hypothetical protein n=1 Tax=Variovorax sp. YR216 TaxID=1882828 RepID=UPI00089C4BC2|nr:hypothetical protein [Variovorax sp. YR216]SEB25774.1 hypothetical protein SAMN05444680_12742 [Variovorax sp. YR216]
MRPAVYTYVLAGDVGRQDEYRGSDERVIKARANLKALVKEVRAMDQGGVFDPTVVNANLFLVPSKVGMAQDASYDFQLAGVYRTTFADLLQGRTELEGKLAGLGPFLVATRLPVNEIVEISASGNATPGNTHMVLIDLTDAEPQSVVVFISIFKDTIRKKNVLSDAKLEPLRATVVSLLVQANQAIPFIGSASAAVRASMSGDTKPDSPVR